MMANFDDANYQDAENYANLLLNRDITDYRILNELGVYYAKTRRLDITEKIYKIIIDYNNIDKVDKDYNDYLKLLSGSKKPYMPGYDEKKEKYIGFMNSLGIKMECCRISKVKQPPKIPVGEYPIPEEHKFPDFKSFVAFDVETTGVDSSKDAITEIAAIKVVDGRIVETQEFTFQELVHPYKKSIPENVEMITGITNEMVKEARDIWEVFPDFAEFIGDNILVGYNCMSFDSKFLVRAGRLSNLIINNEYYDVMKLAKRCKHKLDSSNMKLTDVAKSLGIVNPQAHRALSDAITTAKVYVELCDLINK